MKKMLTFLAAILCGTAVLSAGDTVWSNKFENVDKKGNAAGWNFTGGKVRPVYVAAKGKESGYVRFATPEALKGKGDFCLRYTITKSVKPKTKYELSFKVRGKDFPAKAGSVIVIPEGWTASDGMEIPAVTGEWKTCKKVITIPNFKQAAILIITASKTAGTLELTDLELKSVK